MGRGLCRFTSSQGHCGWPGRGPETCRHVLVHMARWYPQSQLPGASPGLTHKLPILPVSAQSLEKQDGLRSAKEVFKGYSNWPTYWWGRQASDPRSCLAALPRHMEQDIEPETGVQSDTPSGPIPMGACTELPWLSLVSFPLKQTAQISNLGIVQLSLQQHNQVIPTAVQDSWQSYHRTSAEETQREDR